MHRKDFYEKFPPEQMHMCMHFRIRMSFIARYVYTYKEFVFETEATAVQLNDSDRTKKHR